MLRLLSTLLLLVPTLSHAEPSPPTREICQGYQDLDYCFEAVLDAPGRLWSDLYTAVAVGLAWCHEHHPRLECAISIQKRGAGYRVFPLGTGTDRSIQVTLGPGDLAVAHTHVRNIPGNHRCSDLDLRAAAKLPIPTYVQSRNGKVTQCLTD